MLIYCCVIACQRHMPIQLEAFHAQVLQTRLCDEVNRIRRMKALPSLNTAPWLTQAAQEYALYLSKSSYFDHVHPSDPTRETPLKRAVAAGSPYMSTAENLAKIAALKSNYNQKTFFIITTTPPRFSTSRGGPALELHTYQSASEQLVEGWMNSTSHRENIFSHEWTTTGCGVSIKLQNNGIPMLIGIQMFQ